VAKTTGMNGKNFQPFFPATENADASDAMKYDPADANHTARNARCH